MMMKFDLQRFALPVVTGTTYIAVPADGVVTSESAVTGAQTEGALLLEITKNTSSYSLRLIKVVGTPTIVADTALASDNVTEVTTPVVSAVTGNATDLPYDLSKLSISMTVGTGGAVTNFAAGDHVTFGAATATVSINGTSFTGVTTAPQFEYIESKLALVAGTLDFTTTAASSLTLGVATAGASALTSTAVLNGKMKFASNGNVEDMAAEASVRGLATGATVAMAAAGMAQGATVSVNGTTFTGGSKTAASNALSFKISATDTSKVFLTDGTIKLDAGESAYTIANNTTSGVENEVKAEKGDITVTVASGSANVIVSDLDNGDSFTIQSNTYTVVNGQVVNVTTGTKIGSVLLTSANSSEKTIQLTIAKTDFTTGTATAVTQILPSTGDAFTTPDITDGGTGMTVTDVDGNNRVVASFANGQYLHKDGTITSDSTNAIASLSSNDSTGVATYTATSSKAQTIDLTNSTLVWDVTATTAGDTMTGNAGKDSTLSGGDGKDTITAANSNTAIGGVGQDSLKATANAEATAASLTGGSDADVFDMTTAGAYAVITDFSLADGDVLLTNQLATAANVNAKLQAGTVALGLDGTYKDTTAGATAYATLQSSDGFYAARLGDANSDKLIVAWTGENAATIDNSGTNYKNVIIKGTGNDVGDVLIGGTDNDTFYGGLGDSITGGKGSDQIILSEEAGTTGWVGHYVAMSSDSGKDTVTGFKAAFDTAEGDWVGVTDGTSTDITITTAAVKGTAGNVTVKSGNGALVLNNVSASTDTGAVELNINGAKVATIAEGTIATIGSADYAQYYIGTKGTSKKSGVNLSNVTGDLMVDLSQTETIRNIDTLVGGAGNTTLMGSTSADSLVAGEGRTSLWGGASGSDTLVSGADATSFFYGTGSGKDTVVGFQTADVDASDVLTFIDGGFGNISRTSANAFEVKMSSGEKLTVNQSVSGADKAVKWQLMDGTASGVAKIALANNKLTYDNTVTNYFGTSSKDTVSVASSADNASIWLDGSQGVSYSSIEVVDAKSSTGNVTLAGGSGAETIYGGQGASSLWGGADTSNDVLVGGGKGTSVFFYGLGQGNDVINATTKDDTINLYGVKLSDITSAVVDSTKVTVTTTANETLTVNGSVTKFMTGDGQTFYADHKNKTWSTTAV